MRHPLPYPVAHPVPDDVAATRVHARAPAQGRARAYPHRRARALVLVTLALSLHSAALPYSLPDLLRLPLERLLQLEITSMGSARGAEVGPAAPKLRSPRG